MNGLLPEELPEGRLLLHSCCAPCSGAIVEALAEAYRQAGRDPGEEMAIFWSNSNICDREEYDKRKAEILRYAGLPARAAKNRPPGEKNRFFFRPLRACIRKRGLLFRKKNR